MINKIKRNYVIRLWYDMTFNNDVSSKLLFEIIESVCISTEAYTDIKYLKLDFTSKT